MAGSWNYEVLEACSLPEKIATGFTEVFSKLLGAEYTPVLYCGTQVVHGTNHMILCKSKIQYPEAEDRLVKVVLNELEDMWSIMSIEEI